MSSQAFWVNTMKLNTMGRMVTLADENKSWPLNNISTNNFSLNSTSLNNSGPPAWILNLRDIELDPPKLIRGNMEVEQKYKNIQKKVYDSNWTQEIGYK